MAWANTCSTSSGSSSGQGIKGEGSPVFLDELVTDALDDKVLDANVDAEGTITFQVLAQR